MNSYCVCSIYFKVKGDATARKYSSEAALSLRSRRSGTKFAVSLLAKLLIKCRRLPRGFLWNTSLPPLISWLFYFLKRKFHDNYRNMCFMSTVHCLKLYLHLYFIIVNSRTKIIFFIILLTISFS